MPNLTDEELEEDLTYEDESLDEVSAEDEDGENDDEDGGVAPPNRQGNSGAQLRARIKELETEVDDLNKRHGNLIKTSGEKLKAKDREIDEWLERVNAWLVTEVAQASAEAFAEGVASVENNLLPLLRTEDKADYLEAVRKEKPRPSPRQVQTLDTRRRGTVSGSPVSDDELDELIREFTDAGVPLDQLEQTSAKAVISSGTKYLKSHKRELEEEVQDMGRKLEGRARDDSGATRVSSGSGSPRPVRKAEEKRLEEVEKLLRQLKGTGRADEAVKLLNEKRRLEGILRQRRPR